MPSASAKLEKQSSIEANDPLKQITTMVEKKVRNLEKRKSKLDSYRSDSNSGKELNEDQKKAMEKYDQVVEVLDFAKEMQKSFNSIMQETSKSQKKVAKREYLERQQLELQRIKEVVMIQDILNSMGGDDVRNDFLNGTNGAVKLTEGELNSLDELFKLICPERDLTATDCSEFEKQLLSAAEHLQSLLDSKNKEVIGTTYKALKDTIVSIHSCNYFNKSTEVPLPEEQDVVEPSSAESLKNNVTEEELPSQFSYHRVEDVKSPVLGQQVSNDRPFFRNEIAATYQNPPVIPEALPVQGNLNFLQESQIDVESASHSDQPVIVPHSIPAGNYVSAAQTTVSQQHFQQRTKEESQPNHIGGVQALPPPVQPPSVLGFSGSPLQVPSATATPADFDPDCPIPTQTYTNQSFSTAIHPMMAAPGVAVPPSYVPVPLTHPMQSQHILPAAVVAQPVQQRMPTAGILDPSALLSSTHNTLNMLPTSSVSKMGLGTHNAKEHFVNRDFQLSQVSRESHHQNKTSPNNSQYDRVNAHEGYQSANNTQSFMGHDNFSSDSSSYSSNLKRGLPPRGVARGGNRGSAMNASRGRSTYRN